MITLLMAKADIVLVFALSLVIGGYGGYRLRGLRERFRKSTLAQGVNIKP